MARGDGVGDELEKPTSRAAGNHIEGDEGILESEEVFIMGIEDGEVVLGAVIAARGDFLKTLGCKPCIDLHL